MPGVELSGERRLLSLWLILSLLFGLAYYLGIFGRDPFVQRFERAYYAVFWSRPFLSTEKEGLEVGVIAPQYISSLIDSEMWVWVRNTSTAIVPSAAGDPTPDQAQATTEPEPGKNSAVLSPLIVIEYTPKITPQPTAVPDLATTPLDPAEVSSPPTPESTIQAQVLLREGDGLTNYYTESRSAITFTDIYPGETAARLVWVRLMPQAYRQGEGKPSESIYLSEREITGTIQFDYALWGSPIQKTSSLDFETSTEATINTRQAVIRGFARTLLLPPWSNGLLIGLGLISAFMINLIVTIVESRLEENFEMEKGEWLKRPSSDPDETQTQYKMSLLWQLIFWIGQLAFWACAIALVFLLVAHMAETFILCPMINAAESNRSVSGTSCNEWPNWPVVIFTIIPAICFFYVGYLWKSIPVKSIGPALRARSRRPPTSPINGTKSTEPQPTLVQIAATLSELVQSFNKFAIPPPDGPRPPGSGDDPAGQEGDNGGPTGPPPISEETARMKARKRAADLTKEIKVLHKDLLKENTDSLEAIKSHVDVYRARHADFIDTISELPSEANWKRRKTGPRQLTEIDKSLNQLEELISLAKPVKELSDSIREGDPAGLDRLTKIRNSLADASQPPNLEPARTMAAKTVRQIEETERYYQEHFVDLHTNISTDASLVEVLDKFKTFRKDEGSVVSVRFFSDDRGDESKIMFLSDAHDIAIGRLSRYRNGLITEKNDYVRNILSSVESGDTNKQDALSDLINLQNETNDWPGSLPGYDKYHERNDGEEAFPQQVEDLRRDISKAIDALR